MSANIDMQAMTVPREDRRLLSLIFSMQKTLATALRKSFAAIGLLLLLALSQSVATAQESRNRAPGFNQLASGERVVIMPIDVELFEMSAGGVLAPKADWTASAQRHMRDELVALASKRGMQVSPFSDADADDFAEQLVLHGAVAQAIARHHFMSVWALPTKDGKLLWSFGDVLRPLQAKTGARYALFVWVRDSYASAERKVAMVAMAALFGVGLNAGVQQGYASLVDLETGQVLWFNRLIRGAGDLREPKAAAESMDVLFNGFPAAR